MRLRPSTMPCRVTTTSWKAWDQLKRTRRWILRTEVNPVLRKVSQGLCLLHMPRQQRLFNVVTSKYTFMCKFGVSGIVWRSDASVCEFSSSYMWSLTSAFNTRVEMSPCPSLFWYVHDCIRSGCRYSNSIGSATTSNVGNEKYTLL